MASKGYRGFINRLVAGSEKSEEYARNKLPSNRWELFWDIFKGRFGKLIIINFLTLIFLLPIALLIFFRYVSIVGYGMTYPFNTGFGVGYAAPVTLIGLSEQIVFNTDVKLFLILPILSLIASVGLSGGLYIIRNLVWTEGVFVASDFWKGVKQNFKQVALTCFIYSIFVYITIATIDLANYNVVIGQNSKLLYYTILIFTILVISFLTIMAMHMLALCVTYEYKFMELVRNAFFFTIGNFLTSVAFIVLGGIFVLLLLFDGFVFYLSLIILAVFGLSLFVLVWTVFCQYLYDKYLNDKVKGAVKNRGIYAKVKKDQSSAIKKHKEEIDYAIANSMLSSRPIKPITDDELTLHELPQSFSRSDIEKLNESRRILYEDNENYIREHLGDEKYRQMQEAKKNADVYHEERQKRIEKAKRELEKRNKKK